MKKPILALALTIFAFGVALPAAAQQAASPWYVRGAIGTSIYDLDGSSGNKGLSLNLGVGYALSKNILIELGYADFGSFTSSGLTGEAKSLYLGPVFSAGISDAVSIYGRVAAASTSRTSSTSRFSESDRASEILGGIGLGYQYAPNMAATWEYQKVSKSDVTAINVGVRVSF